MNAAIELSSINDIESMLSSMKTPFVQSPRPITRPPTVAKPKPRVQNEMSMSDKDRIAAIKAAIDRVAGVQYKQGQIKYTIKADSGNMTRPVIGFRATGYKKTDRKKAVNYLTMKLQSEFPHLCINVDYPEFRYGMVHLMWHS